MLLRQEERVAPFADITAFGKASHASWIDRVFAPWLAGRTAEERRVLHAQLVAVCDTYMCYLLRRQQGLSREHTERGLIEIVTRLLS